MDIIAEVRRRHLISGESISSITRSLNISQPTIRKYLSTEVEPVYNREYQPEPKLGSFKPLLEQCLEVDIKLPKNQYRTAHRIVIGDKSLDAGQVEYRARTDSEYRFITLDEIVPFLVSACNNPN